MELHVLSAFEAVHVVSSAKLSSHSVHDALRREPPLLNCHWKMVPTLACRLLERRPFTVLPTKYRRRDEMIAAWPHSRHDIVQLSDCRRIVGSPEHENISGRDNDRTWFCTVLRHDLRPEAIAQVKARLEVPVSEGGVYPARLANLELWEDESLEIAHAGAMQPIDCELLAHAVTHLDVPEVIALIDQIRGEQPESHGTKDGLILAFEEEVRRRGVPGEIRLEIGDRATAALHVH